MLSSLELSPEPLLLLSELGDDEDEDDATVCSDFSRVACASALLVPGELVDTDDFTEDSLVDSIDVFRSNGATSNTETFFSTSSLVALSALALALA